MKFYLAPAGTAYATMPEPLHSLLRCQNEICSSKWWARDVMAAMNILSNGLHVLRHGTGHRAFGRRSRGGNEGANKGCEAPLI
jgi:transposase